MKRHDDPILERLRAVTLFAACPRRELALIARHITEHRAPAGEVLIREGSGGREVAVILEGAARVVVAGKPVALVGPGDIVGEIALLDNGPRSATVVTETDVVAQISSRQEFLSLIADAPHFSRAILVGLARRLRAADTRLMDRAGASPHHPALHHQLQQW